MRLRRARHWIPWLFTAGMLVVLLFFVQEHDDIMRRASAIRSRALALMTLAWVVLAVPRGLVRRVMARPLGVDLSFSDWFGLPMVTNLLSLVTPGRGDILVTAAYFRRRYGLPVTQFVGLTYGTTALTAMVLTAEGLLALLIFEVTIGPAGWAVWLTMLGLGAGAGFLGLGHPRFLPWQGWLWDRLRGSLAGWQRIRQRQDILTKATLLIVVTTICFALWTYSAFAALGISVGLAPVLFASVISQISTYLTLTPGNLGVREAMIGLAMQAMGLSFAEGVAVSLLQRAVSTVLFILLGSAYSAVILKDALKHSASGPA